MTHSLPMPLRFIPSWKGPICTRKVNTSSRKYEFKSRLAATKYNPENENLKLSKMRSSTQPIGEKSVQLQCTQSSKFTSPQLLQSQSSSEAKQILPTHQILLKGRQPAQRADLASCLVVVFNRQEPACWPFQLPTTTAVARLERRRLRVPINAHVRHGALAPKGRNGWDSGSEGEAWVVRRVHVAAPAQPMSNEVEAACP